MKDKSKWAMLYLIFIIIVVIWLIVLYVRGKLSLKSWNNNEMVNTYASFGGTKIGGINSGNAKFKHKLRDYYVASSYNSCCAGDFQNSYVSVEPLKQKIAERELAKKN